MVLSKETIAKVIDRINLDEYLKKHLELKRSGAHFVAKCPFHGDSHPSLYIYPKNYHCFACKAHGDVVSYEMFVKGIGFKDAVTSLCEQYNIPCEELSLSQNNELKNSRNELLAKFEKHWALFCDGFENHRANESAFFDKSEVGFCPSFDNFTKSFFLNSQDHKKFIETKNFDKLNSELFVLKEEQSNGKISGFLFFSKKSNEVGCAQFVIVKSFSLRFVSFSLYNIYASKADIRASGFLILTTNINLFFLVKRNSLNNVVLFDGKKITPEILNIFSRITSKIYFLFENGDKEFLLSLFEDTIIQNSIRFFCTSVEFKAFQTVLNNVSENNKGESFYSKMNEWFSLSEGILAFTSSYVSEMSKNEEDFLNLFNKKILDPLDKIENIERKNILISQARDIYKEKLSLFKNKNIEDKTYKPDFKTDVYSIFLRVCDFYRKNLFLEKNSSALKYLLARGMTKNQIDFWNLGFCPVDNRLSKKVNKSKQESEVLVTYCILRKKQNKEEYFDFFYNRILIPIQDHDGRIIAFSGRVFLTDNKRDPKYINSPESPLFSKSKILYNFYNAKNFIKESSSVIVVEGFWDCITLFDNGIKNVVAVMGTALTKDHLEDLKNYAQNVFICFDSDNAGFNACVRSLVSALKYENLQFFVVDLVDAKDPDEYVKKFGAQSFKKNCDEKSVPLYQYVFKSFEKSSIDKEDLLNKFIDFFSKVEINPNSQIFKQMCEFGKSTYGINFNNLDLKLNLSDNTDPKNINSVDIVNKEFIKKWESYSSIEVELVFLLFFSKSSECPTALGSCLDLYLNKNMNDSYLSKSLLRAFHAHTLQVLMDLLQSHRDFPDTLPIEIDNPQWIARDSFLLKLFLQSPDPHSVHAGINLHKKNATMSFNAQLCAFQLSRLVLKLELLQINQELEKITRVHFDAECPKDLELLLKEREKRTLILSAH